MSEENQNKESKEEVTVEGQTEQTAEFEKKDAENVESTENAAQTEEKTEAKEKTSEEKIAELEAEVADLKDQLLRRAADFDNYRKRMIKEKQDAYDYANAALLGDLLESLDNFDRTIDASKDATDAKAIADGVKMINCSLVKMLEDKYGLAAYGKDGEDFNPDEHEAIGRMEEDVEKETLKQVYLKGYKLKDRIIRLAKVMVSVPKSN